MPELMKQISFAKLDQGMTMPHLLDIQTRAFESLLQLDAASQNREDIGLERVFKDLFPITDVHENFSLEYKSYSLGEPKYSVAECIERDMTYSAPLKATLQLVINEVVNEQKRPRNIIEKFSATWNGAEILRMAMSPAIAASAALATAVYANGLLVGETLSAALTIPLVLPLVYFMMKRLSK